MIKTSKRSSGDCRGCFYHCAAVSIKAKIKRFYQLELTLPQQTDSLSLSRSVHKGYHENYSDFYVITAYARFLRENSAQKLFGVNRMATCSTGLFSAAECIFCMEIETSPIDLTSLLARVGRNANRKKFQIL